MEQNIHYDILTYIAEEIVEELFSTVKEDPRLMVCDWRAYAVLEAYRLYSFLLGKKDVPDIESCFNSSVVPEKLKSNPKWIKLGKMHDIHWDNSNKIGMEEEYSFYLKKCTLVLEHFRLSL